MLIGARQAMKHQHHGLWVFLLQKPLKQQYGAWGVWEIPVGCDKPSTNSRGEQGLWKWSRCCGWQWLLQLVGTFSLVLDYLIIWLVIYLYSSCANFYKQLTKDLSTPVNTVDMAYSSFFFKKSSSASVSTYSNPSVSFQSCRTPFWPSGIACILFAMLFA